MKFLLLPIRVVALVMTVGLGLGAPGPAAADPNGGYKSPGQSNDGRNRQVRIHNQTGWTMTALYVSDARRPDWRGDYLGARSPVATGASLMINIDDGGGACIYVLRAEFTNGQALERTDVNACRIADYYFTR